MSYSLGDFGIVTGTLNWPAQGAWSAEVEINTDQPLGGAQTLRLPGVDLTGYIVGGGVSVLRQHLRLVGGKGGLGRSVAGQHFNSTTVRTVVEYLVGQAGETLATDSDAAILSSRIDHWHHTTESAGAGLDRLCAHLGTAWTIKPDGTLRIGQPTWSAYEPDHVLLGEDLVAGTLTLAGGEDTPRPGTSFLGKRVAAVEVQIKPGAARIYVRWGAEEHPFDEALRAAVQHHQIRTLPIYEGRVVTANADGTLDVEPVRAREEVGPGWQKVPLYLVGTATVKVQPGALCLVEFRDNRRDLPFVRSFLSGTFSEISETASSKIDSKAPTMNLGENMAAMVLAGSAKPVVRIGDVLAVGLVSNGFPVTGTIAIAPVISTVKA